MSMFIGIAAKKSYVFRVSFFFFDYSSKYSVFKVLSELDE